MNLGSRILFKSQFSGYLAGFCLGFGTNVIALDKKTKEDPGPFVLAGLLFGFLFSIPIGRLNIYAPERIRFVLPALCYAGCTYAQIRPLLPNTTYDFNIAGKMIANQLFKKEDDNKPSDTTQSQ
mmetsp:Transcript_6333/g.8805  ORF Transcript_6333/g.8805 Transcript_6333/m.8805 type:complete len:124 (+) Transcript_6333:41-412(+)